LVRGSASGGARQGLGLLGATARRPPGDRHGPGLPGVSGQGVQERVKRVVAVWPGDAAGGTLVDMTEQLAAAFAQAVAGKQWNEVRDILHPEVDFRGMTPARVWEADGPADVLAALGTWFDEDDLIEAVEALDTDVFADRHRVGYRLRVRNPDGLHLVEQQAYLSERDGRIGWLRIMCAGYRPVTDDLQPDPARAVRVRGSATSSPVNT